jgi:hypothetical protein
MCAYPGGGNDVVVIKRLFLLFAKPTTGLVTQAACKKV